MNTILLHTKNYLLFILIFSSFQLFSQTKSFVVRLNHNLLNQEIINNNEYISGSLSLFLNEKGKSIADSLSNDSIRYPFLQVTKMFINWKTYDTISISRQGNKVKIPPFWAT